MIRPKQMLISLVILLVLAILVSQVGRRLMEIKAEGVVIALTLLFTLGLVALIFWLLKR